MLCSEDNSGNLIGVKHRVNGLYPNYHNDEIQNDPYSLPHTGSGYPLNQIAGQRSQLVISGHDRGYTGTESVPNGDIETDAGPAVHLNGDFNSLEQSHPEVVIEQNDRREFDRIAKEQHERKRKLLFTQKSESEPSRQSRPPKHRAYSKLETREKSYVGFISECRRPARIFAKAGFFYKGFADIVACFQCGVVYKNWQRNDDPIIMHHQLKYDCPYIVELRNEGIESCDKLTDTSEDDVEMKEVTSGTKNLSISSAPSDPRLVCKVCTLSQIEVTIQPCGHLAVCESCCRRLRNENKFCPICRGPIIDAIRTYVPE